MRRLLDFKEHSSVIRQLVAWGLLAVPVAALAGSASALFLWVLDRVTELRWEHPWLLYLLPLGGLAVGWTYKKLGKSADRGNNLIIEQIHAPGGGVPARMAPLVFAGTILTHLFGGSAGREGTAVQMGGSIANAYARLFRIDPKNLRVLLMAGVAAGFGSVFGTPLAGAVFAMEVLVVGQMQYEALIPVLIASLVGDAVCSMWGIHHTVYHIAFAGGPHEYHALNPWLWAKVIAAAIPFGLASLLFAELTHSIQDIFKRSIGYAPLRSVAGGILVILLTLTLGTEDYLGLGVHASPHSVQGVSILSAFDPSVPMPWAWWWKTLFTAVTLASGFKGGEVTPLFFIGATLGHALAVVMGAPVDLFAGLGFIAVFAGAANTPLACTIMGAELFGAQNILFFAVACFVAYFCSGHSGIYMAQRLGVPKRDADLPPDASLSEVRAIQSQRDAPLMDSLVQRVFAKDNGKSLRPGKKLMSKHHIAAQEMGKIRIYLAPRERVAPKSIWDRLNGRPAYREIIREAKKDGLKTAMAFMTHYGFTNEGRIEAEGSEISNPSLTLCVEIIDHRDALENFVRKHGDLLNGRVIVYKHVEHWSLQAGELDEEDASPDEIVDGNKAEEVPQEE